MKRQQITKGSILEIPIDKEYYVYAQILFNANYVFFDYKTTVPLTDFTPLKTAPILFIVALYADVVNRGQWLKVGKMDIRDECQVLSLKYIKDVIDGSFRLYDPNTGEMRDAAKEECRGLEVAAVWEGYAIEERIRDHYNGVENIHMAYNAKFFDS